MSLFFFDGFDFASDNAYGPGGRLWDQGSSTTVQLGAGRWGGLCVSPNGSGNFFIPEWPGMYKAFPNRAGVIVGCAMRFDAFHGTSNIIHPFMYFADGNTPQCSVWINPDNGFAIEVRTGRGTLSTDTVIASTGFIPPLTLWFYFEIKVTIGSPGSIEIHIDGQPVISAGGVTTSQSGSPYWNVFHLTAMGNFGPSWIVDDLYLIDPNDATGNTNFLGEVRVQTHVPDADGHVDFLRSQNTVNYPNVALIPTTYLDNGKYNYDGTVNNFDSYSITPFLISGNVFGVQSNLSVRKDDTGSRSVAPLLKIASTYYQGTSAVCYSSYTYHGDIWEYNPATNAPWTVVDLNLTEFGIKVTS